VYIITFTGDSLRRRCFFIKDNSFTYPKKS
jgi:hypothetical protein